MSQSSKKQTFLHGTALLALATAIVKIIGALYKIPLKQIIGDDGYSYFDTAYQIYSLLLLISTAGLPVAMSRMISQSSALGYSNQVRRTYTVSRNIFLILGVAGSLLMVLCCKPLANLLQQPDAYYAIACLGPCVLLICLMSAYRGFFQGHSNMLPTSKSQVLEAAVKLIVGIALAWIVLKQTGSVPMAAGGAILGVTVSCVASALYLFRCFHKAYGQLPESTDVAESSSATLKSILAIAVPITIGAAGLQLLNLLESALYMGNIKALLTQGSYDTPLVSLLREQILQNNPSITLEKLQEKVADNLKGIYNMTQTVYNLPVAFITPITISIIPAIASHLSLQNNRGAKLTAESAVRITGLVCMPCAAGLIALSSPVMALLGGYSGEKLTLAAGLMAILGICVIFNSLVLVFNAIMQAHGHPNLPVINMFIGGIVKLVAIYILTKNPNIGIYGVPVGSLLCYLTITVLNLITMRRSLPHSPAILRNLGKSVAAAVIMGLIVYGCYYGLRLVTAKTVLLCAVPVIVGVASYAFAAIKLKAITHEDCLLLPKGDKLAKILKL